MTMKGYYLIVHMKQWKLVQNSVVHIKACLSQDSYPCQDLFQKRRHQVSLLTETQIQKRRVNNKKCVPK